MQTREQRGVGVSWSLPLILAWTLLAILCLIPRSKAKSLFRSVESEDSDMSYINMSEPKCGPAYFKSANEKEILDFLLHKSCYDGRNRPYLDDNIPARVNVSVLALSLSSPDESSLKYEIEFLLDLNWVDPRLRFEAKKSLKYLSGLHHVDDIWLPDILFIKHGDFKKPLDPEHIALKIYRNGSVSYTRRLYLELSCRGSLAIFPFDDPYCTFSMESKTYEATDIELSWLNNTLSNGSTILPYLKYRKDLNAYPAHNETKRCDDNATYIWRGNYSCLQVDLKFHRDGSFYLSTVFAPSIILVTSSFITFWLEWNAVPARIMIGVTTMLNFFTTSNNFRATLPVVSGLQAMNVWDSVCISFIYGSVLEFVFVNYRGRKRPAHNMVYTPGENFVVQVLAENRHRIPQAFHRIGLSLREYFSERRRSNPPTECAGVSGSRVDHELQPDNRNSHEHVSCTNCGNSQCSQSNIPNSCTNGEDQSERAQVEYTFNKNRTREFTHPIRLAKSIDVMARIVFPLAYAIFLIYFFVRYKLMQYN